MLEWMVADDGSMQTACCAPLCTVCMQDGGNWQYWPKEHENFNCSTDL